jgi:hypothetical protein
VGSRSSGAGSSQVAAGAASKGETMTATALAHAGAGQALTGALRRALLICAVAILLVSSFVIGRATVATTRRATLTLPSVSLDSGAAFCRIGHPC